MWRVHGVLWLQNTKLIFPTFFLWRSLEAFIKTRFFVFLMKKAFWWRVACYVRAIGEKHDLGPAEHTMATRSLFDSTVPRWIHIFVFFCHDSCGRNIGFCGKTPFLSVFGGAADLTVVWAIICLRHKKKHVRGTPKNAGGAGRTHTRCRLGPAKKMRICVSCDDVITFRGPEALSTPRPRATPVPVRDPIGLTWRIFRG